jgi:hypothetical protein
LKIRLAICVAGNFFETNEKRHSGHLESSAASFAVEKGKVWAKRGERRKCAEVIEGKEFQGTTEKWQLTRVTVS